MDEVLARIEFERVAPHAQSRLNAAAADTMTSHCDVLPFDRERDAAAWDAFVAGHESATHYHQSAWHGLIRAEFGQQPRYLMARDSAGKVCGVLPLVRLRSRLFGHFMVSMPYLNYGGVLASDPGVERALADAAIDDARSLNASHIEIPPCGSATR